jgi:transcriptional/translational regulatory protein YebC/TACO1
MVELGGDEALRMQKLLDIIEDLDDVQDVYHNAQLDGAPE